MVKRKNNRAVWIGGIIGGAYGITPLIMLKNDFIIALQPYIIHIILVFAIVGAFIGYITKSVKEPILIGAIIGAIYAGGPAIMVLVANGMSVSVIELFLYLSPIIFTFALVGAFIGYIIKSIKEPILIGAIIGAIYAISPLFVFTIAWMENLVWFFSFFSYPPYYLFDRIIGIFAGIAVFVGTSDIAALIIVSFIIILTFALVGAFIGFILKKILKNEKN